MAKIAYIVMCVAGDGLGGKHSFPSAVCDTPMEAATVADRMRRHAAHLAKQLPMQLPPLQFEVATAPWVKPAEEVERLIMEALGPGRRAMDLSETTDKKER